MYDVVTIGTATLDVFLKSSNFKVLKDPHFTARAGFPEHEAQCFALGSKLEVDEIVISTGGGATNTAVTFSRQGLRVAAACRVGQDEPGLIIRKDLEREGVRSLLLEDERHQTAYSTILISQGGERTILVYRGASALLHFDELPWPEIKTRWAYISPGGTAFEEFEKIITKLSQDKVKIALNPSRSQLELGLKKLTPIFQKLDILIVNREEGSYVTGAPFEDEKSIFKILDDAVQGIVVMTEGPKGVLVSDGKTIYRAGIFENQRVVDRTGAGDAFGSGFVAALVQEKSIEEAIRFGSANATSVVESIGAKTGILTQKAFNEQPRWKNFRIQKNT